VPGMHRKHSGSSHRSRICGRNSGDVHRQVQKILRANRLGLIQKASESKGEMIWQARREAWSS
jgi:hypothetical protein